MSSWPYNCAKTSIVSHNGVLTYVIPMYECCDSCKLKYARCSSSGVPQRYLCHNEALNCMTSCSSLHNPNNNHHVRTTCHNRRVKVATRFGITQTRLKKLNVQIKQYDPKCEKITRKNGRRCIQQLCLPL